jgi:hypothetical protein
MLKKLNKIVSLKDPLKQYQGEFVISDLPGLMLAKLTQSIVGKLSGNTAIASSEELRLRCTSYSYPGAKVNQTELMIGSFKRRIGSNQDRSGVWECTITEDMEGSVLNLIEAWCDLIHSPVSGIRLTSSMYSGTCKLTLGGDVMTPLGKKLKSRTIYLMGFYPISYSVGNLNPSSSEPVSINVKFNYDYFAGNAYNLFGYM